MVWSFSDKDLFISLFFYNRYMGIDARPKKLVGVSRKYRFSDIKPVKLYKQIKNRFEINRMVATALFVLFAVSDIEMQPMSDMEIDESTKEIDYPWSRQPKDDFRPTLHWREHELNE